mgnify:FL=1
MHLTVLQLYAVGNLLEILGGDVLVEEHVVHLLLQELGMCQLRGQLAIVGEQEHARGVAVETANGIDALRASVLHEIHHGLALLRIVRRGYIILGLIEQDIDFFLYRHWILVEQHLIGTFHLRAELGDDLAIHLHGSRCDELVCLTTRAHAGIGKILVQADGLVRVDVLLFIFDALLQAVLGIRVVTLARSVVETTVAVVAVAALTVVVTALTIAVATLLAVSVATLLTIVVAITTLTTRLITALRVVALAWLVFALLTGLIATLRVVALAWLVFALLTGLIATLRIVTWARLITALTRLVATLLTGLVTALARLIATLLTRLVTALTRLVATLLTRLVGI